MPPSSWSGSPALDPENEGSMFFTKLVTCMQQHNVPSHYYKMHTTNLAVLEIVAKYDKTHT